MPALTFFISHVIFSAHFLNFIKIFMKKDIHPKYNKQAKVSCVCGNTFSVGSTVDTIQTELCSMCHPFFTGEQKIVDTARRVDRFHKQVEKSAQVAGTRQGKKAKRAAKSARQKTKTVK